MADVPDANQPERDRLAEAAKNWWIALKVSSAACFVGAACQAALFGPLLAFTVNDSPLCPDAEVSGRLETFLIALCVLALLRPLVQAVLFFAGVMCTRDREPSERVGLCTSMIHLVWSLSTLGLSIYGAVVYEGADDCKDPAKTYGFVMLWMNVATFSLQCCATCIAGTVAALDHF